MDDACSPTAQLDRQLLLAAFVISAHVARCADVAEILDDDAADAIFHQFDLVREKAKEVPYADEWLASLGGVEAMLRPAGTG
jgi:hypothetical protein